MVNTKLAASDTCIRWCYLGQTLSHFTSCLWVLGAHFPKPKCRSQNATVTRHASTSLAHVGDPSEIAVTEAVPHIQVRIHTGLEQPRMGVGRIAEQRIARV